MYYFSMVLVVAATLFYHISQKSINENVSPGISMIVTYAVALSLSLIFLMFTGNKSIAIEFKEVNWASYVLGIAIFVLEIGFLLVYRSGWNINIAGVFSNVVSGVILVFIGLIVFKENLSLTNVIGIGMSILGLVLINK